MRRRALHRNVPGDRGQVCTLHQRRVAGNHGARSAARRQALGFEIIRALLGQHLPAVIACEAIAGEPPASTLEIAVDDRRGIAARIGLRADRKALRFAAALIGRDRPAVKRIALGRRVALGFPEQLADDRRASLRLEFVGALRVGAWASLPQAIEASMNKNTGSLECMPAVYPASSAARHCSMTANSSALGCWLHARLACTTRLLAICSSIVTRRFPSCRRLKIAVRPPQHA